MSSHIYLRIGVEGSIKPGNLVKSLRHSYEIVRELDASVTGNPKGAVDWGIDRIKKESPLEVAFTGAARTIDSASPMGEIQSALIAAKAGGTMSHHEVARELRKKWIIHQ